MTPISPEPSVHHANLPRHHSHSDKNVNWLTYALYSTPRPVHDNLLYLIVESASTLPSCSCYLYYTISVMESYDASNNI